MRRSLRAVLVVVLAVSAAGCAAHRPGPAAETRLGMRAAELGMWREAALRFERASEARPGDAALLNDLAVAYESLGRLEEAERAYAAALERAPGDGRIRGNAEQFRRRHGGALAAQATPAGGAR